MNTTLTAGRPKRGTVSLDEKIIVYLSCAESTVTWRDLKGVVPGRIICDSSLKKAIDRLVGIKKIIREPALRGRRRTKGYRLRTELPAIVVGGKTVPFMDWISSTCRELAAARMDWFRNADGRRGKVRTLEEAITPPADLLERQGTALAIAMKTLKSIILDEILTSYFTDSEEERNQYLDAMCRIYLSVLIKEIALLAHPAHGDLESAIRIAKGLKI